MKKKGNITLLVLFVLIACSLLGILAIQYTKHMATQANQIYSYYKTYYLAKGGSEIGLSLMKLRGPGYSLFINSGDSFTKLNISTGNTFSLTISGRNPLISKGHPDLTGCKEKLSILSGETIIIPLFTDEPSNAIPLTNHFSETKYYINKSQLLETLQTIDLNTHSNVSIGVIVSSGGTLEEEGIYFTGIQFIEHPTFFETLTKNIQNSFDSSSSQIVKRWKTQNGTIQNYLVIANKGDTLEFCLKSPNGTLATPKTYISSFGYSRDKKMGLETIYQQPTPSYLIDSSINK